MQIKNNHGTDLGLPDGQVLPAGTTADVRDWGTAKKNRVVAGWLASGVLEEGDAVDDAPADRDELIAKLAALNVKHHPNTGVPKLQALLADAEAAHASKVEALAIEDGNFTADDFAALPEEERAALLQAAADKLAAQD